MKLTDVAKKALSVANGDKVDVIVTKSEEALTRFANSYIHQNVKQTNGMVRVRVIKDGKTGIALTNSFDEESVIDCAKKANELADLAVKDPQEFELPGKSEYKSIPVPDEATKKLSPDQRADIVAKMVSIADKDNLKIAGQVSNSCDNFCVVNNNGVEIEHEEVSSKVSITAMSEDSSGQADMTAPRIGDINAEKLATEACGRAVQGRNPISIDPGDYEVVMLPYATAEFLRYMIYTGFSAESADSKRSWVDQNMGKKVLSDKLTLIDDPFHPMGTQSFADAEGYPKDSLMLVENGIPKNIAFNSYFAAKMGKKNTGHATGGWGPMPINVTMSPGKTSVFDMIKSVKKGILISRFWYTNIMDPMTVQLTTMTRDGLFLIEDGKVTKGLKNMRITDKVLRVYDGIIDVGDELINTDGIIAPAVHLKSLNFSGSTKY